MQANLFIWCQPKEKSSVATLEEKLAMLDLTYIERWYVHLGVFKHDFDSVWFSSHMLIFASNL
jgi:hypothetical protein